MSSKTLRQQLLAGRLEGHPAGPGKVGAGKALLHLGLGWNGLRVLWLLFDGKIREKMGEHGWILDMFRLSGRRSHRQNGSVAVPGNI